MNRRLPPFSAIRAFEAAARLMSFKAAAEELCVTPSAISHQVKTLEEYLGQTVFLRAANKLALTRAGQSYLAELTGLLDQLSAASDRASVRGKHAPFRVQATAAFNARWLVPRLNRCPLRDSISIRNAQAAPDTDFTQNDADLIVHWGDTPIPGAEVIPMLKTGRFPIASPEIAAQIKTPSDILNFPLLRDEVLDGWAEWFALAGVPVDEARLGAAFNANCDINMTAAERHQGVVLAYGAIASDTLAEGRLIRLFDLETEPVVIYSVAYPQSRARDRRVTAMRDWLIGESIEDGTFVKEIHVKAAQ